MKKIMIMIALLIFGIAAQAQQRYKIDIKKSKLQWKISTMGNHFGYLLFNSGTLDYSAKAEPIGGLFIMNMNSIRSTDGRKPEDVARVDAEIKTPDFFDVKKFPTATMKVKQITNASKPNQFKVMGDLTIKGITKPIEFFATIKQSAGMVHVWAELKIDRTAWNIHHKPKPKTSDFFSVVKDVMMEDEINILLDLYLNK